MRAPWRPAVLLLALALHARPAAAGCGCDKPPPLAAPIRPAFVPAGGTVTLFAPRLREGTTYSVAFGPTPSGVVSATAVRKRDYADGVDKPQLVVTVPDLPAGPTAVTVRRGRARVLAVPADQFTLLQRPISLSETNTTTIASCYRAAVGADGTAYFPLEITPISQRMFFSGALRGYRLTFDASDVTIYNSQGVLMQLLGPAEAGIFSIQDDAGVDGPVGAGATRRRIAGDQVLPDSILIDFDADPAASLSRLYYAPTSVHVSAAANRGTGVPASGGLVLNESANLAAFLKSLGGFEDEGTEIAVSVDMRFGTKAPQRGIVGLFSGNGGRALLQVSSLTTSMIEISMNSALDGSTGTAVQAPQSVAFTPNWLRLKTRFAYTGGHLQYEAEVVDIGPAGIDAGALLATLSGTLENAAVEGNEVVLGAFGGAPGPGAEGTLRFDNFTESFSLPTTTTSTSTTTSTIPGNPGDPDASTTTSTTIPYDVHVKSFRLGYDRHEFQTYRALHATNPDYYVDPTDPAWHVNGTRHIDHDHLIVAIRGLVDGTTPLAPGETPPFDFRVTTSLVDAPPSGTPPITVLAGTCDLTPACAPVPQAGCGTPMGPGAARLALRNRTAAGRDQLAWDWRGGQPTPAASFGDPMARDGVALCVYDESGTTPALVLHADAPGGSACRGGRGHASCWRSRGRPRGSEGFVYRARSRAASGLDRVLLQAGDRGRAKIAVAGSGGHMALPSLPLPLPLRVQLQAQSGACWEASYSAAGVRRNAAGRFKAKAD